MRGSAPDDVPTSYVYGNYIDEVLRMDRDLDGLPGLEKTFYYLRDDQYNVLSLVDAADGNIAERYVYGAFGEPVILEATGAPVSGAASAIGNRYMFNGREYDADTGLYYYRTRYMDPKLGRFIARDTIGLWGDENNLGNPFAYVGNNPWTHLDPYGEGPDDRYGTDPYVVEANYALSTAVAGLARKSWNGAVNTFDFIGWYFWASDEERQQGFNRTVISTVGLIAAVEKDKTGAAMAAWGAAKQYGSTALDTPSASGNAISDGMLLTAGVAAPYARLGSLAGLENLANLGRVTNKLDDVSFLKSAFVDEVPKSKSVTYFRVQGGGSRTLVQVDSAGDVTFKLGTSINVSTGTAEHADYFLSKRPGGSITSFEIPDWLDDMIRENAIDQDFYKKNPLNQGGLAPKKVDRTTPGTSYELPPLWSRWLQENVIPGSGRIVGGGSN